MTVIHEANKKYENINSMRSQLHYCNVTYCMRLLSYLCL